jgi:hypothetical protein
MFGAFKQSMPILSGLVHKQRFRLTSNQKYRLRQRLKAVDTVVDVLVESGVRLRALDLARLIPRESALSPFEKYFVKSRRGRDGFKPIHWVPKWTKVPHPRQWKQISIHEYEAPKGKDTTWDDKV